jgi:hypothetical protein
VCPALHLLYPTPGFPVTPCLLPQPAVPDSHSKRVGEHHSGSGEVLVKVRFNRGATSRTKTNRITLRASRMTNVLAPPPPPSVHRSAHNRTSSNTSLPPESLRLSTALSGTSIGARSAHTECASVDVPVATSSLACAMNDVAARLASQGSAPSTPASSTHACASAAAASPEAPASAAAPATRFFDLLSSSLMPPQPQGSDHITEVAGRSALSPPSSSDFDPFCAINAVAAPTKQQHHAPHSPSRPLTLAAIATPDHSSTATPTHERNMSVHTRSAYVETAYLQPFNPFAGNMAIQNVGPQPLRESLTHVACPDSMTQAIHGCIDFPPSSNIPPASLAPGFFSVPKPPSASPDLPAQSAQSCAQPPAAPLSLASASPSAAPSTGGRSGGASPVATTSSGSNRPVAVACLGQDAAHLPPSIGAPAALPHSRPAMSRSSTDGWTAHAPSRTPMTQIVGMHLQPQLPPYYPHPYPVYHPGHCPPSGAGHVPPLPYTYHTGSYHTHEYAPHTLPYAPAFNPTISCSLPAYSQTKPPFPGHVPYQYPAWQVPIPLEQQFIDRFAQQAAVQPPGSTATASNGATCPVQAAPLTGAPGNS